MTTNADSAKGLGAEDLESIEDMILELDHEPDTQDGQRIVTRIMARWGVTQSEAWLAYLPIYARLLSEMRGIAHVSIDVARCDAYTLMLRVDGASYRIPLANLISKLCACAA